jgi:sialidase-1
MILKSLAVALVVIATAQLARSDDAWQMTPALRQQCLAVLRQGMRSGDFWPAIHAAEAMTLAGHPREVRQYLEPLLEAETDDQRRCGLARELVRAGDLRRSMLMLKILLKSDTHGHVHAAESLYKVGWEGDDAPLRKALAESENINLRIMAAAALAKHGEEDSQVESFAFLRGTLREQPDAAVFRLAAWVLGRIGEDKDRGAIRSRLNDTRDVVDRAFLQHALAALGDPEAQQALLRNLESSDAAVRTYAAVFAGESGIFAAVPFLVRQLDDDSPDARIRAAQALLVLAS